MKKLLASIFVFTLLINCKQNTEFKMVRETYSNGKTKVEFVYQNKEDKKSYIHKEYHENGKLSFIATVESGMFVGLKQTFNEDGKLMQVDSLTKPCELEFCCCDGLVKKYKANGKMEQSFENKNGVANGLVTFYNDSTEKPDIIYTYLNNKRNGAYISFYPSGKVFSKGTFKNDTLVGYQYFFKENGDTLKYNYSFNGKMDFPYKKWLDNGQVLTGYYSSEYEEVTYVWYDKLGKEIKRQIANISGKNWVVPE